MLSTKLPTAKHNFLDTHDTALKSGRVLAAGLGIGWIDQRTPFQRSARVNRSSPPSALYPPIATHASNDVHEIRDSHALVAMGGFGVFWSDQRAPFHRSASVRTTPEPSV